MGAVKTEQFFFKAKYILPYVVYLYQLAFAAGTAVLLGHGERKSYPAVF